VRSKRRMIVKRKQDLSAPPPPQIAWQCKPHMEVAKVRFFG